MTRAAEKARKELELKVGVTERLRYKDFELNIQREGDRYTARIHSPGGDATGVFTMPFTDDKLELLVLRIGGH